MGPLKRSGTQYVVSQNVRRLMKEGKSRSVAVAIAFREAKKNNEQKRK